MCFGQCHAPGHRPKSKPALVANISYDGSPIIDYHLDLLFLWGSSSWREWVKSLKNMARPERFELPTTWFEVRHPTVVAFPLSATFIADYCTTFLRYYFSIWACFLLYCLDSLIFIGDFQRRYFGQVMPVILLSGCC